jgi:hypothetical protein
MAQYKSYAFYRRRGDQFDARRQLPGKPEEVAMHDLVIRGATVVVVDGLGHEHGVFVNGVGVFEGNEYARLYQGPGQVLDRYLLPAGTVPAANAAP